MRTTRTLVLARPLHWVAELFHQFVSRLVKADAQYRAARRLEDLPEHLLFDIGLVDPARTRRCLAHRELGD